MNRIRGNSLAGMLITIAIMAVLAVVLFKGSGAFGEKTAPARKDGLGTTVLGQVRYDAKDTVCRSNIRQLRQSIEISESSNDDQPPATLQDTHLGADFYKCPLGGEAYVYDPATGKVHCPHPGHEKY